MNDTRLRRLALLAEVVSATVVVISIAFLVAETRNNTKAIHVQTHLALTTELNQWREQLNDDAYLTAREKAEADGVTSLSWAEQNHYMSRHLSLWSIYESAFFAYRNGALDKNGWERFSSNMCRNYAAAARIGSWNDEELMARGLSSVVTEDFGTYIAENCPK
jgi:hypothetical protein